jgi:phosphatidylserine decarboxylase precursor-related protein
MVADDPDAHCIVLPDYDPAIFRNPKRPVDIDDNHVIAPVDGKVVVIEEVFEGEYFKDQRLQVSIFMSPINVHVTRYPVNGKVKFSKYHPGNTSSPGIQKQVPKMNALLL